MFNDRLANIVTWAGIAFAVLYIGGHVAWAVLR